LVVALDCFAEFIIGPAVRPDSLARNDDNHNGR